jgi:hypothetical protein
LCVVKNNQKGNKMMEERFDDDIYSFEAAKEYTILYQEV